MNYEALQPDSWTDQDTETSHFDNIVLFPESFATVAKQSSDFGSWWSDYYSLERSAQSTLAASSQDQLPQDHQSSRSLSSADSSVKTKSHQRLPLDAVKALRLFLYQHQDSPCPTPDEKAQLEQQMGLNESQILDWFANARRRRPRRLKHEPALIIGDRLGAGSTLSPLERWKHSPPGCEPAATSDIMRALENAQNVSELSIEASSTASIRADSALLSRNTSGSSCSSGSSFLFGAPSMSEFEYSCSSGSATPIPSMGKRYRRRKNSRLAGRQDKPRTRDARIYQCIFCCDSFRTKYEWTRHEKKALHISVDRRWGAPEGGLVEVDGVNYVFCQAQNAATIISRNITTSNVGIKPLHCDIFHVKITYDNTSAWCIMCKITIA